jgi:very-short-patch-repair endonuclease
MDSRAVTEWLAGFASRHHGIVCGQRAAEVGITRYALDHRVDRGELVRLAPGVFRMRDHPATWESRASAALIEAGPGSALGFRSAARLHKLWRYREASQVEIVKKRGGSHKALLGRLVEASLLDADNVIEIDGFPCTSLARTIFDLLGDPDHRPLRSPAAKQWHEDQMMAVVNDAMRYHGLTVLVELVLLASIGRRGRPGTALVRKIFKNLGADYVPDESQVESVFSALLRRTDLPPPVKQFKVVDAAGLVGFVDFAWPALMLLVEVDSRLHHGPLDRRADAERDRRLRARGYEVLRVEWTDLVMKPDAVLRRLRGASKRGNLR